MTTIPDPWIRAAALVAARSWRSDKPLDAEVALGLKQHKHLGEEARGFVADAVSGMARRRRFVERAATFLPFDPTREAMVCLWLVGPGGRTPDELPLDRAGRAAIRDAVARAAKIDDVALASSAPSWLVARFTAARGDDDARALVAALGERPPQTVRANTLTIARDALVARLGEEGAPARATTKSPVGASLTERASIHKTASWREGFCELQDEGSQLVGLLVDARPGMLVVDGCAGAGGKTLHLAAQMANKGMLYALDTASFRLDALKKRARKAGVHNIRVHVLDDEDRSVKRLAGKADAVLVDAPCSGTGVLRRAPDIGWRLVEADVARMNVQQRAILDGYAGLPKRGGRLVYATCSLLPAENEAVVADFLEAHPEYAQLDAGEVLRGLGVFVELAGPSLVLTPHRHGTDGFFAAVLERR